MTYKDVNNKDEPTSDDWLPTILKDDPVFFAALCEDYESETVQRAVKNMLLRTSQFDLHNPGILKADLRFIENFIAFLEDKGKIFLDTNAQRRLGILARAKDPEFLAFALKTFAYKTLEEQFREYRGRPKKIDKT